MNIVLALPGNNFSGNFLDCYTDTLQFFGQKGWSYGVSRRESSNVYHVRSMCLGADVLRGKKQAPFNGSVKYDWIIWIDISKGGRPFNNFIGIIFRINCRHSFRF